MPRKGSTVRKPKNKEVKTSEPKEIKSVGLGDTIEKITKATGIAKVVKTVFPDCGCQERKEWLNKTFKYVNQQKSCMNEEQYTMFKKFKETYLGKSLQISIPHTEMVKLIDLYNTIFQVDVQGCSDCSAGVFVQRLDKVYMSYEKEKTGK